MDEFLNSQFIVNFQDIIVPAIFSTLRMLFFSMLFGMIIGMVAVSYTHLDVYKRQLPSIVKLHQL